MSGPIVRKYGFPNFESIFGDRPLQHGGDEPAAPESAPAAKPKAAKPAKAAGAEAPKKKAPKKK